ncbi:MAG: LysR family transcriptional regulator [Rubrivivax sp.]|nr:LysR family transcriptional regulator [Rubrivivax sp.]
MAHLDWYIRANLKFRHLQLLVAIDDLRHVGRVAAYLNVTQPAVSKTLAQLEQGLGMTLFERTSRGMEPTDQGNCLIRHARQILGCLVSARDELMDISEGRITRVSIGVLPSAAAVLVPRFVAALESESTDVAVNVREGTMSTLLPTLRAGDIDLVVGLLPERPLGAEFATDLLYEDPIVVAVRRDHPLTALARLDWPALADYPMVLPPTTALTRSAIDNFMIEQGVTVPRRHVDSVSTLTNIGVLQFTDSVGFLSRDLARHFAAQGALQVLPLEIPSVRISVGLVWMADRHMGAAQRLVRQLLRETAARLPRIVADTSPLHRSVAASAGRPPGVW